MKCGDWQAGAGGRRRRRLRLSLLALCRLRLYPTGLKNSKMKTVTATTDRHITNIITHTAGLYGSARQTHTRADYLMNFRIKATVFMENQR